MIFVTAEKRHFVYCLSLGLLSLPLLTECNKIRLVGPTRCSGRLEVYNNDVWGTVCDDQWSITNAEVVCRELNCGTALEAKKGAFFGEGPGQIWLDDVQCVGSESSVLKCSHRPLGENNCGHTEDAGVICLEYVRVVNGSNRCSGRVEVHLNGKWNRMCASEGSAAISEVVCQETNCGSAVTPAEVPYFGESPLLDQVKSKCFGNESSLQHCTHEEKKETCIDATVVCKNIKPIRLLNGTGRCSGRLEIYHDGQWGTICDDRWGMQEATVACQELDCGTALSVKYKAHFGRGKGQVWLDDLDCTGHETAIGDCPHRGFGEHDCDHNEDASVVCSEWIRLMNGTDRCSGRVEVFHDGKWAKICKNWGNNEAAVVCQELDCGSPKAFQEIFHFGDSGLKGYTSRCSGNVSSISQCTFEDYIGSCEGASLSCSGVPSIRLVNGTDRCSGRVEVYNDGQWGTVCDDEWDISDAQVVCRSMDCGTAVTAKSGSFFGQGHGDIWLDDLGCFGNETSLFHCRHPTLGENNCGHGEDAGVVCSADIRLINGTNQCSGRVEFYRGGQWSSASNQNWGMNEAAVVCREMNCGDPVKFSGSYGRGGQLSWYRISCSGRESSLAQCTVEAYARSSQDRTEEASVTCSGNVKLSDGHHRCVGRVEFFDKGQWGAVCGESWDTNDANVVCRQLNCERNHKITTISEHGHGSGKTWNSQIECRGSESTLSQCSQRPFRDKTCNTTSVAGVVCTGSLDIQLVDGKECEGRVEVRHGEVWQTVCDTDWNMSKAQVVCEMLDCGNALNALGGAPFGQGIGTVVEANSCFDNETTLQQCSLKGFRGARCGHDHDAGVRCAAPIRMVGGSGQCSGRVEVLYKGQWGTVCDDEWELVNADVVCRQLGCGHAVAAPASAHFGQGTGPIWLDNVECAGEEAVLTHCKHPGFGQNNCGHGEDASVICLGSLEKPLITFSPATEVKWGDRLEITCTVLTQHLGGTFVLKRTQDSFKRERFSEHEATTFSFPKVDFSQSGSYFCEYQKKLTNQVIYYPQGNTADLTVTVKLEKPIISLTSAHAMVIYSPEKISVAQGSSFSITCSIHSSFRGGIFYLKESHLNTTQAIPAFDHSVFFMAYFEFPKIDYQNQGEYSCVYAINISSRSFSSDPSRSLQVTVVATSSSVALGVVGGVLVVLLLVLVTGYFLWRRRRMGAGTLVQFSNRFGGAIQQDTEDMNSGRGPNAQVKDHAYSRSTEDNDADDDTSVERVSEDLDGRVCYELEPLVLSCLLSLPLLTECNKIRLVGPTRCSGRLEVYNNDVWGTVCDDQWSITNADVVCRELNCGAVLEAKKGAFFGEGPGQIWLDDVQCVGSESSVLKCSHRPLGENNCGHAEDAGVICSEYVRVVNGSNRCSGRVEVHLNGKWNRMCASEGSAAISEVVCQETNCGSAVTPAEVPYFGESPLLDQVKSKCFGNESSLQHCTHEEKKETCIDATVVCKNIKPIRLLNGTGRCSGRLEIYHDGQWGTICDDRWGMQEATVACQELDCGTALSVKYKAHFGRGKGQVWLDDLDCTGHETAIGDCPHRGFGEHDCDHNEDASVVCSEWIRLMNGTDRCSGRVEVFHDGKWAKICKNWGNNEAAVVCQELDCGSPKAFQEIFHFGDSGLKGYTSRCSGNVSSISQCTFEDYIGSCEGASLSCSGVPSIRLVNGTDRCSGRVEVYNDGQWGTVCDDEWDISDAQVVCRSMDCGTAVTAKSGSFFGQGHGDIWLDDLGCLGNETSLFHCRHPTLGENNCGHGEDAGVVCSADIRLINGTNQCSGRVEFYRGGQWSSASNQNWGMNEAAVVCREMNCGDPVKFSGSYGRGGQLSWYRISCSGRESSLAQCTVEAYARSSQDRTEEASVTCSGNVKLSDGHHRCVGRVEFFDKGQWGAVCGESWDTNDANVVCRQLNCGRNHKITTISEHGHGSGKTWNSQIECRGSESTLSQCSQRPFRDKTCNTTSVAGVVCTGSLDIQLVDGKDECEGRVEVRHGEVWQTVCDTDWNMSKAQVVCEMLDCGNALNALGGAPFGQGIGTVVEANSCFDNATTLQQCSLKGFRGARCGHDHDAGVRCAAPIRMVGGSGQCSGRVEVLYKGQWGTVCDDEWELVNADVVCRQLGCGHAVAAPASAHFGRGTGPIWLDNVECAGEEAALTHCKHPGFGENNCGHGEDASVICLGSLEKPLITFSPATEVKWGDRLEITCTVLTQHLGGTFVLKRTQDSFKRERFSEHEATTFSFPKVDFSQSGSYFCEYQKKLTNQVIYYPQGNTADLTVTVKLEKPSISLTSAHAMVIYSPEKISVAQGSSFSITCSIHSSFRGGIFYLKESHLNTTQAIPAFDHSVFFMAYFEFPKIDYQNQGEYSCVYAINISSRSFSSDPSRSLQVTVVATSSSVALGVVGGVLVVLLLVLVTGYFLWRRRRMGAGTLVQFSNRFGGAIQQDTEDMNSGRGPNAQVKDHAYSRSTEDNDADDDTSVERVSEDLDGRVCYELEPLVLS
ncbi:scavenger receptor cysteine-rich domain-containing protein DMBT1 [Spinachia spinachia]